MFGMFKKQKKQDNVSKIEVVVKKERTHERKHEFTEREDIKIIKGIVEGLRYRELAINLNVTDKQIANRVKELKDKGLRIDRKNNSQMIVSMAITNRDNFTDRKKLLKEVENLISKIVVHRELKCIENGEVKTSYSSWKKSELNSIQYYVEHKNDTILTPEQLAKSLGRSISSVKAKIEHYNKL